MLRLKKLRRQRDPTSTSATKFVAQRTSERHRRSVGTLDERSRPTTGRRRTGGECVRCTRKTTSQEPDARTHANTGGSGVTTRWSEKYERTWSIARSPALGTRKYRMPRRWQDWDKSSGQK